MGASLCIASEAIREKQVFCTPFNEQGFKGDLSIHLSPHSSTYASDSSFLSFDHVPETFRYQTDSYIQIFSLSVKDSKPVVSSSPLEIELFNNRAQGPTQMTEFIDQELIHSEDFNGDILQFFSE